MLSGIQPDSPPDGSFEDTPLGAQTRQVISRGIFGKGRDGN